MQSTSSLERKKLCWPTWKAVTIYYAIACGWAWLAWSPVVLGVRRSKAHRPECVSSGLYMHSDSRTILWLLSDSPFGNRQLESRSPFASKPPAMAMVADGSASPAGDLFCGLSRTHFERQPCPVALAARRSDRVVGSYV
jgi:hypothetical protein